jgi:hypothetical protein
MIITCISFTFKDTFSYGCPIDKPDVNDDWIEVLSSGKDGSLNEEHGSNFVCRYLSFLDRAVVSPGTYASYFMYNNRLNIKSTPKQYL